MRRQLALAFGSALLALSLAACSVPADDAGPKPSVTPAEPTPSPSQAVSTPEPAPALSPEEAFINDLPINAPTLSDPVANNPAAVFIDWGGYQCQLLRDEGAQGLFNSLINASLADGDEESRKQGLQEEVAVTATAVVHLCPEMAPALEEFMVQAQSFGSTG